MPRKKRKQDIIFFQERDKEIMAKIYSFLFIGNSYTFYNDMPAIFRGFAEAAGYDVDVTAIAKGGYTLSRFADPADEYGAMVEAALAGEKKYDFVILQEQSVLPATEDVADFYDAVRNLTERIQALGAKPILYATWGRKEGAAPLAQNGWTNESMTWRLAAAYQAIGDEVCAPISYAGLAFYDVYTHHREIELYDADGSHPSYEGSYLAAATLFARIFDTYPDMVAYHGELSPEVAEVLCDAASKAIFQTPLIPTGYCTGSKWVSRLS